MNTRPNVCPICCKPAHAPYRRVVDGKIVEGCVDKFHTGHLVTPSGDSHWHNRPQARAIRKQLAAFNH